MGSHMNDLTIEEQRTQMALRKVVDNAAVISNITELVSKVISDLAGKDIAEEIDGDRLTKSVLTNLVGGKLKNRVLKEVGYVK